MVKHLDWHHLYSELWKNEIAPAAFQHPAKYSRALIRHIYEYLIKEKMVKPGDVCIVHYIAPSPIAVVWLVVMVAVCAAVALATMQISLPGGW